jgi:hypothetical protein
MIHCQLRFIEEPMGALHANPTENNADTASSLLLAVDSSVEHNPQIFQGPP